MKPSRNDIYQWKPSKKQTKGSDIIRNFPIHDKKDSFICYFYQECDYNCNNSDEPEPLGLITK